MARNKPTKTGVPLDAHRALRDRADAFRHAEEDAARERVRALRYEEEDRRRTFGRRWIKTTVIAGFSVAGLLIGIDQFNRQSEQTQVLFKQETKQTRELFVTEFQQNREMFEEEAADRKNARMVRAWQLLKDSVGEPGNVGQITALETLNVGGEHLQYLSLGCVNDKGERVPPCVYLAGVTLGYYGPSLEDLGNRTGFAVSPNKPGALLSGANLSGADLRGANLSGAALWGADLRETNLSDADLYQARLGGADLSGANLSGADLRDAYFTLSLTTTQTGRRESIEAANLSGANLSGADLSNALLNDANLSGANLSGANLSRTLFISADLSGAQLVGADFRCAGDTTTYCGATLGMANISGANFEGAKGESFLLESSCADPDDPPINLPNNVERPEVWEPCPPSEEGN